MPTATGLVDCLLSSRSCVRITQGALITARGFSESRALFLCCLAFEQRLPNPLLGGDSQTLLTDSAVIGLANHVEIDPHDLR